MDPRLPFEDFGGWAVCVGPYTCRVRVTRILEHVVNSQGAKGTRWEHH